MAKGILSRTAHALSGQTADSAARILQKLAVNVYTAKFIFYNGCFLSVFFQIFQIPSDKGCLSHTQKSRDQIHFHIDIPPVCGYRILLNQ